MSNSTYIEMEDDVREDIGECLPSAPKKEKRRMEDVKPEPQEEQVTPDNKPEPEPQAKFVTQEEYFSEVSKLNGKIRELEQKLSAEQQQNRNQKEVTEEFLRKSEACLDAVSAMLECSGGATHRMRNFYATAMMKFIGNTKKILRSYADPMPF